MNGEKNHPPLSEEIELTLLGPGFGESIVIHIGDNKWIIVDSCINNNISSCAPLDYLTQLGVDFSNVVLVVATHWHDDHVKKMSDVVQACTNAKFCCSSALKSDEFMAYVTRHNEVTDIKWTSGVVELNNIIEILSERKKPTPIHAVNNKRILQKTLSNSNICEVWTLSPSDKDIENFIKDIRNLIPIENDPQKTATTPKRNTSSVVIHIKIGNEVLLLGSDLEETKNDFTGWGVIVASEEKPEGKAKIFKVPHHGSITGHSNQVWQHLVDDQNPYAILTPYNRGRSKLPRSEDAQRICSFTDNAYSTINLHSNKTTKRPSNVEKKIAQTVGNIRSITTKVGMLRLRKNMILPLADWDLKTFDGGCHLSQVWKSS